MVNCCLFVRGHKDSNCFISDSAVANLNSSRQGFTRANTKCNQNLKAQPNKGQSTSPVNQQAPPLPPLSKSPSISSTFSEQNSYVEQPKRFLDERYAKCSVKGNFLTLAAQPKNVELGEWLAHQCTFDMGLSIARAGETDFQQWLR